MKKVIKLIDRKIAKLEKGEVIDKVDLEDLKKLIVDRVEAINENIFNAFIVLDPDEECDKSEDELFMSDMRHHRDQDKDEFEII